MQKVNKIGMKEDYKKWQFEIGYLLLTSYSYGSFI